MSTDPTTIFLGNEGPRISRRLSVMGSGDYDIVLGQTFRLRARPRDSDLLALDVEMTPDVDADIVYYDPQPGDFSAAGPYRAWIYVVDINQDVAEFDLLVLEHAPGVGVRVGAVYRAARALAPVAWDALQGFKNYGDVELQRAVDLAKLRVTHVVVLAADEAMLDPRVIDYVAKKCLVDSVLPAAKDFWTDQLVSQTALGNSTEVRTYPDRLASLEKQMDRYAQALLDQAAEVIAIIGPIGTASPAPILVGGGETHITATLDDVDCDLSRRHWWMNGGICP